MNSTRNWGARTFEQFRNGRRRSGRFGKLKLRPSLNLKQKPDINMKTKSSLKLMSRLSLNMKPKPGLSLMPNHDQFVEEQE